MEKKSEFEYFREIMDYFSKKHNHIFINLYSTLCEEETFLFDSISNFNRDN